MNSLAAIAALLDRIEARLDRGDYEALGALGAIEPVIAPVEGDEAELQDLAQRVAALQVRVASALAEVEAEMAAAPALRRASKAYVASSFGTAGS